MMTALAERPAPVRVVLAVLDDVAQFVAMAKPRRTVCSRARRRTSNATRRTKRTQRHSEENQMRTTRCGCGSPGAGPLIGLAPTRACV